ncbi:MAG TPA: hypothetical protein VGN26_08050, partial [Armatimonadota bacterium]
MSKGERRWVWGWIAACLALSTLPYLYAWSLVAGTPRWFVGVIHYPDDVYVYLAWMRQAAEGHFLFVNRFDLEPQRGLFVNLLFWVLGAFAGVTHVPLIAVFHLSRLVLGAVFLRVTYSLIRELLISPGPETPEDESPPLLRAQRRAAFLLVCFSAGLGFLFERKVRASPVDAWQTEANSFLSLYQNPLFLAGLSLMVGILLLMLRAERQDRGRPAAGAGLLGLLLANVHSYDILTIWAVWTGVAVLSLLPAWRARGAKASRAGRTLGRLGLLYAIAAPAVIYQAWLLSIERSFRLRALVPTQPAAVWWYLLGLGLLVPLACVGLWRLTAARSVPRDPAREQDATPPPPECPAATLLLPVWALVQLGLPYVPVSFSRKLVMGVHPPFAILAGVGLTYLAARALRIPWSAGGLDRGRQRSLSLVLALGVLATTPTLATWFRRALADIETNTCEGMSRLFFEGAEGDALNWLSQQPA